MNVTDGASFSNLSATSSVFGLRGGTYSFDAVFTGTGGVGLECLGADNLTYLPVMTAFTASGFTAPLWLSGGQYKVVLSGAAGACYCSVAGVQV
jgi:hypothetical protein